MKKRHGVQRGDEALREAKGAGETREAREAREAKRGKSGKSGKRGKRGERGKRGNKHLRVCASGRRLRRLGHPWML
jgi:hypothetical protein